MKKMKFHEAPKSVGPKADSGKLCALNNCVTCDLNMLLLHTVLSIHIYMYTVILLYTVLSIYTAQ